MDVEYILKKLKKDIKDKKYDYVPTGKNKASRRKFGLTMFEIEDFLLIKILSCHEDEGF